jgi:hypothetical protein
MEGKHPKTIIINQDLAMRVVIYKKNTPKIIHRNRFFHIVKKAKSFFAMNNEHLHENLFNILRNSLTESEFELLYKQLPENIMSKVSNTSHTCGLIGKICSILVQATGFYLVINSTTRTEKTPSWLQHAMGLADRRRCCRMSNKKSIWCSVLLRVLSMQRGKRSLNLVHDQPRHWPADEIGGAYNLLKFFMLQIRYGVHDWDKEKGG